jgi:hypothetical protein
VFFRNFSSLTPFSLSITGKAFYYRWGSLAKTTVESFYRKLNTEAPKITNVYGPAECCVDATSNEISRESIK